MTNMETKSALRMCRDLKEFDDIMKQTWCKKDADKIYYLKQLFNVNVVHATDDNKHSDYVAMAEAVMKYAS